MNHNELNRHRDQLIDEQVKHTLDFHEIEQDYLDAKIEYLEICRSHNCKIHHLNELMSLCSNQVKHV